MHSYADPVRGEEPGKNDDFIEVSGPQSASTDEKPYCVSRRSNRLGYFKTMKDAIVYAQSKEFRGIAIYLRFGYDEWKRIR